MASRTVHADAIVSNMFVPFISSINDEMTYAQIADQMEADAFDAVRKAIPQFVNDIRIRLEVGE